MARPRVYVLDDEPTLPHLVREILPHASVAHYLSGEEMIRAMERSWPDAVVCDLAVNRPREGFEVLQTIFTRWARRKLFALLVTRYFSPDLWKAVHRWGVDALDVSDLSLEGAREKLRRALARFIPETWEFQQHLMEVYEEEGFITRAPRMLDLLVQLEQWKDRDHPIVLMGETGVGKTFLARILARRSRTGEFLLVSGPRLGADVALFPVEFFGEEPGPHATRSDRVRVGYVEMVEEGTLILDEFCALPLSIQAMLLRLVEERRFEKPGSGRDHLFLGRLILLTGTHPDRLVAEGKLRADLWSRLRGYAVEIPPLRERPEDVERFLFLHGKHLSWNSAAREFLLHHYTHPFNFRGLRHLVERLTLEGVVHVGQDDVLRVLGGQEVPPAPTDSPVPLEGNFVEQLIAWMIREGLTVDGLKTLLVRYLEDTRGTFDRNPSLYRKLGISRSAYYRHRQQQPRPPAG